MTREPRTAGLSLDFFGVQCIAYLPTGSDRQHFAYYFSDFLRDESATQCEAELELAFDVEDGGSFVEGLQRPDATKRISLRRRGGPWTLYEKFTSSSSRPSPIPPFHLAPLDARLQLFHAACVQSPTTGGLILFAGPSFSGKSTLTLAMARLGFRVLTDDIAVLDRARGVVVPFCRPVGIRENTRAILPWIDRLPGIGRGMRFETDLGKTFMVRFDELFPGASGTEGRVTAAYLLESTDADHHELTPLDADDGFAHLCRSAYGVTADVADDDVVRAHLTHGASYHRVRYRLERDAERVATDVAEAWL